jgi:hypothetical protein
MKQRCWNNGEVCLSLESSTGIISTHELEQWPSGLLAYNSGLPLQWDCKFEPRQRKVCRRFAVFSCVFRALASPTYARWKSKISGSSYYWNMNTRSPVDAIIRKVQMIRNTPKWDVRLILQDINLYTLILGYISPPSQICKSNHDKIFHVHTTERYITNIKCYFCVEISKS